MSCIGDDMGGHGMAERFVSTDNMGFSLMSLVGFENYVLYLILDFHLLQSPSHAMPIGSKSGNLAFVTTWPKGLRHTDSPNSFSEGAEIGSATCAIHFSAGIRKRLKRFKMIRALYIRINDITILRVCLASFETPGIQYMRNGRRHSMLGHRNCNEFRRQLLLVLRGL